MRYLIAASLVAATPALSDIERTQAQVWESAATGNLLTDGGRLLTVAGPASAPGLASFTEPLARGGSVVLVARADPDRLAATFAAERATARLD